MRSSDDFDFENAFKDEMDLETFRDTAITLIWRDDKEAFRRLCQQQIMLPFILEKVIGEIAPGNRWNDVLFLMGRRLIEADPMLESFNEQLKEKAQYASNPSGGREILAPFVREELSPAQFMNRVEVIAGTHALTGLEAVVAENPSTTRDFIRRTVGQNGGTMDPNTRLFQLLCEMAVAYRNHHHQSDLLDLLQQAGGQLNLLKSADTIGTIRVFEGSDVLHKLMQEAARARAMLQAGDSNAALALFEEVLPRMETVLAGTSPVGAFEYANALLFSGVLLALKGEEAMAQQRFLKCMSKRFAFGLHGYGALLLTNVHSLRENAITVRNAFSQVAPDAASHLAFACFFKQASGHDFSEVNALWDRFLVTAGDRDMDEAFAQSEQLLDLYAAKRSSIVPHSVCELMVRMFRACHFALKGDRAHAQREYVEASHGEVPADVLGGGFEKMAADPEKTLSHYFGD